MVFLLTSLALVRAETLNNCGMRGLRLLSSFFRKYSSEASVGNTKLKLSFSCPHEAIIKESPVYQVNLSSSEGDMGVLANHVPSLIQLRPGLIEIFADGPGAKRSGAFFVSGGFATVNPDSSMQIAALEAVSLDKIDDQSVSSGLAEAQKKLATAVDALSKAEAQIHLEVFQQLSNALLKSNQ